MNKYRKYFIFFVVLALTTTACSPSTLIDQNEPSGQIEGQMEEGSTANSDVGREESSSQSEPETDVPEVGYLFENPAPMGVEVVADNKAFTVTGATRPADDIVAEANQYNALPEPGEEYLLVEFEMTCTQSPDEECSFTPFNMLVYGSLEERHTRVFVAGIDNEHGSVDFNGGETISGVMPFLVGQDETDLLLIYQPFSGGAFFFTVPEQ